MAAVKKPREPVISDMSTSRSWSGTIDIGDGITLPKRLATYADGAEFNDPVDLYDAKNGVTLYGYIDESDRDGYALVVVNSITPEGRYDVIHGHGPGDRVWWQDRPKLKIGGTE